MGKARPATPGMACHPDGDLSECDLSKTSAVNAARARAAHNCEYVDRINALIPEAEMKADSLHPEPPRGTSGLARAAWRQAWEVTFFRAMDRLAEEAGLRTRPIGRNGVPLVPVGRQSEVT